MNDIAPEELLRDCGISYKIKGNSIWIKCLFHDEKTESLSIQKDSGVFHCFGCHAKGNLITLWKHLKGTNYPYQDKEQHKQWYNPLLYTRKEEKIIPKIKVLGKLYHPEKNLEVKAFLNNIGIEKKDVIDSYEIRYSIYSEMIAEHLINTKNIEYTKMRERIIIPIKNEEGQIINYEGRTYVKDNPKVLYVKGGSTETLFNYSNIDKNKEVVIVEGIKDWFKVYNVTTNVIAMFHAIPSDYQIKLLEDIAGTLIFFGDHDQGFLGSIKNDRFVKGTFHTVKEKLSKNFKWIIPKEKNKDPNDCSYEEIECYLKNTKNSFIDPSNIYGENKINNKLDWF